MKIHPKGKIKDAKYKRSIDRNIVHGRSLLKIEPTRSYVHYTKGGAMISLSDVPAVNTILKRRSMKPITLPKFNLPE